MKRSQVSTLPEYRSITDLLRGQSSKIIREINDSDKVVIINKQNQPQAVIISYKRYKRLKESAQCDI